MFHSLNVSTVYCNPMPQSNFLEDRLKSFFHLDIVKIERGNNGKPYAKDLPGSFNLSHSGKLTALYINPYSPSAGCDLQLVKGKYSEEEIAEFCFTPEERAFPGGFFLMWTLKEAYLKAKGLSVFDMPSFSVMPEIHRFRSWEVDTGDELYFLSVYPASEPLTLSSPYYLREAL